MFATNTRRSIMEVKERRPYCSLTKSRKDKEGPYTGSSGDSEDCVIGSHGLRVPTQKSYSSSETLKAFDQHQDQTRLLYGTTKGHKDMVHREQEDYNRQGTCISRDCIHSSPPPINAVSIFEGDLNQNSYNLHGSSNKGSSNKVGMVKKHSASLWSRRSKKSGRFWPFSTNGIKIFSLSITENKKKTRFLSQYFPDVGDNIFYFFRHKTDNGFGSNVNVTNECVYFTPASVHQTTPRRLNYCEKTRWQRSQTEVRTRFWSPHTHTHTAADFHIKRAAQSHTRQKPPHVPAAAAAADTTATETFSILGKAQSTSSRLSLALALFVLLANSKACTMSLLPSSHFPLHLACIYYLALADPGSASLVSSDTTLKPSWRVSPGSCAGGLATCATLVLQEDRSDVVLFCWHKLNRRHGLTVRNAACVGFSGFMPGVSSWVFISMGEFNRVDLSNEIRTPEDVDSSPFTPPAVPPGFVFDFLLSCVTHPYFIGYSEGAAAKAKAECCCFNFNARRDGSGGKQVT
ncbi:teneurin-3 isoform X2 [Solea senegalensis]|uniref:Teneurin-3 isoform X2 n=1 Tax=Solea senegalensis TaxID=28829 RepID=A0AAV6Q5L1_SOLSE|nr:teneurin-3 isoform X2 [Solea senegalensis]